MATCAIEGVKPLNNLLVNFLNDQSPAIIIAAHFSAIATTVVMRGITAALLAVSTHRATSFALPTFL